MRRRELGGSWRDTKVGKWRGGAVGVVGLVN